jgi:hypothetical protein
VDLGRGMGFRPLQVTAGLIGREDCGSVTVKSDLCDPFVLVTPNFGGRNRPGDVIITWHQYICTRNQLNFCV